MNNWNRLLGLLDITLGFPNKIRSSVKKKGQAFDQRTGEHVFMLEYRIKVKPGIEPPAKTPVTPRDLHAKPPIKPFKPVKPMNMIRELMTVKFVNTVDSSPSLRSPKSGKRTTRRKPTGLRKIRPNPPRSPIRPV